ncbi:MAG: alpha/beta hydrolase [Pseudomonadota bacterium]
MTPLVLVHGFMGGSAQWTLQSPLAEGRSLVCLDLPGFGRNADKPVVDRIEDFAEWALKELTGRGIDRFDLLGHSMGGMIVQEMVRHAPDRVKRLVLYATGSRGALPGRFETIETSKKRAMEDGARATARRIAATWFSKREDAEHYADCAAISEMAGLDAILSGLTAMQSWSGEANLSKIGNHTLVLWGDGDRTYDWSQIERLWTSIPNSTLGVIPSCAHAVHAERPDLFNAMVHQFLAPPSAPN